MNKKKLNVTRTIKYSALLASLLMLTAVFGLQAIANPAQPNVQVSVLEEDIFGPPIEGVAVTLTDPSNNNIPKYLGSSDEEGIVEANHPQGDATIFLSHPYYDPFTEQVYVPTSPAQFGKSYTLTPNGKGTLRIVVNDGNVENPSPIQQMLVTIFDPNYDPNAPNNPSLHQGLTDAQGVIQWHVLESAQFNNKPYVVKIVGEYLYMEPDPIDTACDIVEGGTCTINSMVVTSGNIVQKTVRFVPAPPPGP